MRVLGVSRNAVLRLLFLPYYSVYCRRDVAGRLIQQRNVGKALSSPPPNRSDSHRGRNKSHPCTYKSRRKRLRRRMMLLPLSITNAGCLPVRAITMAMGTRRVTPKHTATTQEGSLSTDPATGNCVMNDHLVLTQSLFACSFQSAQS